MRQVNRIRTKLTIGIFETGDIRMSSDVKSQCNIYPIGYFAFSKTGDFILHCLKCF